MENKITKFFEQNSGANARKGFKFQDYVGIYYMLYLYKNKIDFEIFFETRDDLEIKIPDCLDKIQVKSNKLSINKLISSTKKKKSIYEKLINKESNNNFDKYIVACRDFNETEKNKYFSKVDISIDNIYNILGFKKFIFDDKFHVHIIPFTDDCENAEYYVCGYARNSKYGSVFNIDNHINNLVKRVGELGEYKITNELDYKRKKMVTSDLVKIDKINKKRNRKELILATLTTATNEEYVDGIKLKISSLELNPCPEIDDLEKYELPDIEDKKYIDYFNEIYENIKKNSPLHDKQLIFAWAINKYLEEGCKHECDI